MEKKWLKELQKLKEEGKIKGEDVEKAGQVMIKSFEILNTMETLVMTHVKFHGCCNENINCAELGTQLADLKLPLIREMIVISPSGYIEKDFLEDWQTRLLQAWSKVSGVEINPPLDQYPELCRIEKYSSKNIFYLGCDEPASQTNSWINKKAFQLEKKFGKMTWLISKEFSKHIVFQTPTINLKKNLELSNDFLLIIMPTSSFNQVKKLDFKNYYAVVLKCNDEGHWK